MDEDLSSPVLAARLNALSEESGCTFRTLPEHAEGSDDADLPDVCRQEGAVAILTHDKSGFGAEIAVQQAVVTAGVSVVMLRLPNEKTERPDLNFLAGRIITHLLSIVEALEGAQESLLITVRKDKAVPRNLPELLRQRLS
jgi:hypothetical protein